MENTRNLETSMILERSEILFIPNMDLFFSEYNFQNQFIGREKKPVWVYSLEGPVQGWLNPIVWTWGKEEKCRRGSGW